MTTARTNSSKGNGGEAAALRKRLRRLRAVADAAALGHRTLDLAVIAQRIVATAARLIGAERGSIFLVDEESGGLVSLVAQGVNGKPLRVGLGEGIVGTVAATGRAVILNAPYADARFDPSFDRATGFTTRSLLTVPVRDRERRLVAVLQLLNRRRGGFSRQDAAFLSELGVPFALALSTARLHQAIVERERMERELKLAAEIQRILLPSPDTHLPGLESAVVCRPCHEVGGDYYDFIPGEDGTWWIALGDVAGKGVPSALIASNLQSFLWSRRNGGGPLGGLLAEGNNLLQRLTQGSKYATLVLLQWAPGQRRVTWANAGHPPGLLLCRGAVERLGATGPPLGLIPDLPYRSGEVVLAPGDRLLLVTDGVTEASTTLGGEEFGLDRTQEALGAQGGPAGVLRTLQDAVAAHLAGGDPSDDLTCVCLEAR